MIAIFRKQLGGLIPANTEAEERLSKIKFGTELKVEFIRPRNLQWMKKYWVLMKLIADNIEGHYSPETISDVIKVRTGHSHKIKTKSGIIETPKSIAFNNMSQTEWEDYFERVITFVCEEIIPGLSREQVRNEVLQLVA